MWRELCCCSLGPALTRARGQTFWCAAVASHPVAGTVSPDQGPLEMGKPPEPATSRSRRGVWDGGSGLSPSVAQIPEYPGRDRPPFSGVLAGGAGGWGKHGIAFFWGGGQDFGPDSTPRACPCLNTSPNCIPNRQ